ncbi:MAG: methyltransferase domain-containing protein, partial [Acidobacteriota bacterium]
MKTVAIIQARMGSSRLPGKVMKVISGKTILGHVVKRARAVRLLDEIVVATTTGKADDVIEVESARLGVACFRGDERDVLDRYYRAAQLHEADVIVRLTADCPLLDVEELDRAVGFLLDNPKLDYVALGSTYPEGYGVEAFKMEALSKAWREAGLLSEREHVTPYIWKHADRFSVQRLELEEDCSRFRVTVDEESDLQVVSALVDALEESNPFFGVKTAVEFLKTRPDLTSLNSHIPRQAGYWKSVNEDARLKVARLQSMDEEKEATVRDSEKWAEFYRTGLGSLYPDENLLRLIKGKYADIPRSGRALDVGFGRGGTLIMLAQTGYEAHGLEVSGESITAAEDLAKQAGVDLKLGLLEGTELTYPDSYFDIVISWNAVYYYGKRSLVAAAIEEFRRVLRPEGVLLMSVIHPNSFMVRRLSEDLGDGARRIDRESPYDNRLGMEIFYDATSSGWRHLLAGFKQIEEGYV